MKVKKNPEVEIGRNSSLYFAIGLNLMLFFSWQALEYKTYVKEEVEVDLLQIEEEDYEEEIPIVYVKKIASSAPPPPPVIQDNIQIIEDNEKDIVETVIESSETGQDDAIIERSAPDEEGGAPVEIEGVQVVELEEHVEVPFAAIENVPVFPGCEGKSKKASRDCFQQKMNEHVLKHFKYPQAALDLGIEGRVSVIFVIDQTGEITSIKTRGPDINLEKEAERIVSLLPKMTPGSQRDKPVKVSYALPIFFKYAK